MDLTNLIVFHDETVCSLDEGRAVDVIYLDFSKTFDTVSHNILVDNLVKKWTGQMDHNWWKTTYTTELKGWWITA